MRWYEATVYERIQTGTDATHNPVCELRRTETVVLVRTAPMSARHEDGEGNRFDVVERTFLTRADRPLLEGAAAVEVRGVLYEVKGVAYRDSAIAIRVRRCK